MAELPKDKPLVSSAFLFQNLTGKEVEQDKGKSRHLNLKERRITMMKHKMFIIIITVVFMTVPISGTVANDDDDGGPGKKFKTLQEQVDAEVEARMEADQDLQDSIETIISKLLSCPCFSVEDVNNVDLDLYGEDPGFFCKDREPTYREDISTALGTDPIGSDIGIVSVSYYYVPALGIWYKWCNGDQNQANLKDINNITYEQAEACRQNIINSQLWSELYPECDW